ncbi:MAG: hypothetical protein GDA48_23395 [Hormoscilla sp. GM102CHS1]|nr:hypothetical protein [Hormoscilla sp. GM102CHS1]
MSNINLWRTASLLSCLAIATAASSLSAQAQTSESLPPLSTTVSFPGSALTTAEALMDQPPTSHSQQTRSENTSENNAVGVETPIAPLLTPTWELVPIWV